MGYRWWRTLLTALTAYASVEAIHIVTCCRIDDTHPYSAWARDAWVKRLEEIPTPQSPDFTATDELLGPRHT